MGILDKYNLSYYLTIEELDTKTSCYVNLWKNSDLESPQATKKTNLKFTDSIKI